MKKLIKNPLKVMAAAAFMVVLGYGVSTNSEVSEPGSSVNLSAFTGSIFYNEKRAKFPFPILALMPFHYINSNNK